jgi:predicted nucleic acid-binding protein
MEARRGGRGGAHAGAGDQRLRVVIDDLAGRRCAEAHGLPLIGTLGVVVLAKRIGRIAAARPVIEELRNAGLRVTDDVVANALKRANE